MRGGVITAFALLAACHFEAPDNQSDGGDGSIDDAPLDAMRDPGVDAMPDAPVVDAPSDGPPCAWGTRRALAVANGAGTESLSEFPVRVLLRGGIDVDPSMMAADGHDLRFTDPTGAALPYEIETWNPNGDSIVWLKLPQIPAGSTGDLAWMYYGNPSAPPAASPTQVWSAGYVGVWHFGENPAGAMQNFADASPMANAATAMGNNRATGAQGPLGSALQFNGTTNKLTVASDASFDLDTMTLEAWVKPAATVSGGFHSVIEHDRNGGDWWGLWLSGDKPGAFHCRWSSGGVQRTDFGVLFTPGEWHYVACTVDAVTKIAHTYQNAAPDLTVQSVSPGSTTGTKPVTIGAVSSSAEWMTGSLDEIRVSNVVRSPAWITAQYLSMTTRWASVGAAAVPPSGCAVP